jgi:hypothetical protein
MPCFVTAEFDAVGGGAEAIDLILCRESGANDALLASKLACQIVEYPVEVDPIEVSLSEQSKNSTDRYVG